MKLFTQIMITKKTNTNSLSSDSPVVSFDKNQLMQINYDSRFVHLAREVKLLSSMGFKIAPEIHQNSRMAEDFMQHAKDLEQASQSCSKRNFEKLFIITKALPPTRLPIFTTTSGTALSHA